MRLNLENDYANRIILKFSQSPVGKKFRSKDLSDELNIPERFTYRILRKLLLAGLIDSVRGPKGGYVLSKDPEEITMYDVYKAISGDIEINMCISGEFCGSFGEQCPMHNELKRIQKILVEEFKKVDFGNIMENNQEI